MKQELLKNVHISKYAGTCKTMSGCVVAEIESTVKALSVTEHQALRNYLRKNEHEILKQYNGEFLEIIDY